MPERSTAFGRGVAWTLVYRGRTAADLADTLGIARSTVSRWMTGHSEPRLGDAEAVATELDVPFALLVDPGDDRREFFRRLNDWERRRTAG